MRIDTIGVVTARRPAALTRCLTSYIDNAVEHGRAPRVIVCDDAVAPHDQAACRDAVQRIRAGYPGIVEYVGLPEKLAVLSELVRARCVPPEVIKFAFFDVEQTRTAADGANRNMLMLQAHGAPALMVDDDTLCATHRPLGYENRVSVRHEGAVHDPSDLWVLGARDDERGACRGESVDCLGEHERWLGRAVDGAAPVMVTANGFVGDCGWGSPAPYLFLRGASLARLAASNDAYDDYTTSRRVMRAVSHTTICERTDDFMSGFFAPDLRGILPPFPPVCRGSDRVFGALVARCCHDASFAYLPLVLAHRPISPRTFWRGEITRSAAGIDFATLLCALLDAAGWPPPDAPDASTGERLRWYGQHLEQAASSSRETFVEHATAAVRSALEQQIALLEESQELRAARAAHFRRDLRAYSAALRRTAERPDVYVPLDLVVGRTDADAQALTQRLVQRFGQLLAWWPTLLGWRSGRRTHRGIHREIREVREEVCTHREIGEIREGICAHREVREIREGTALPSL